MRKIQNINLQLKVYTFIAFLFCIVFNEKGALLFSLPLVILIIIYKIILLKIEKEINKQ